MREIGFIVGILVGFLIAVVIILMTYKHSDDNLKKVEGCLIEHRVSDGIYDSCVDLLFEDEVCYQ